MKRNCIVEERIEELKDFYDSFFDGIHQFTYIYGSYATGYATDISDLDIVTISDIDKDCFMPELKKFIIAFHEKYRLEIDEEVPYDKKLICPFNMMDDAVEGKGFQKFNKKYKVPFLDLSFEYLSSDELMQRILLNTITNQSTFVSGDVKLYNSYKMKGWEKMIEVVFNIESCGLSLECFVDRMITNNGRVGRDYMGYSDEPSVRNYLYSEAFFRLNLEQKRGKIIKKDDIYYFK